MYSPDLLWERGYGGTEPKATVCPHRGGTGFTKCSKCPPPIPLYGDTSRPHTPLHWSLCIIYATWGHYASPHPSPLEFMYYLRKLHGDTTFPHTPLPRSGLVFTRSLWERGVGLRSVRSVPTARFRGIPRCFHAVFAKDWARFAPSVGTLRFPTPLSHGDRVNSHPLWGHFVSPHPSPVERKGIHMVFMYFNKISTHHMGRYLVVI